MLNPLVARIPMPSLVAVMIMVSIGTFSWRSVKDLRRNPWQSSLVMVATVVIVVWTRQPRGGRGRGRRPVRPVLRLARSSGCSPSRPSCRTTGGRGPTGSPGEIFFASAERFADAFDFKEVLDRVVIDLSAAHFWDITGVGTLDKAVIRFRREGTQVEVVGLNDASTAMVERFAVHDKPDAEKHLAAH